MNPIAVRIMEAIDEEIYGEYGLCHTCSYRVKVDSSPDEWGCGINADPGEWGCARKGIVEELEGLAEEMVDVLQEVAR